MRRLLPFLDAAAGLSALVALFLVALPETAGFQPWVKAAPALLWALSFVAARPLPGWGWASVALVFAALGDFFLARGSDFFIGAGAFAAMQILYSFRFWDTAARRPRPRTGIMAAPLAYAAVTAAVLALAWPRLGGLALPMAVYAVLLVTMASGSAAAGRGLGLALGGLLFFVSDALIMVFLAWPAPQPWATWAILVPYYLGQQLIVLSLRKPEA